MNEIRMDVNMILAGDIGGTKTLLGLFTPAVPRPQPILVREFPTLDFPDLVTLISTFAADSGARGHGILSAGFGVAGPVLGETAVLTNAAFTIDAVAVARAFEIERVRLLNDLEAIAYAVPALERDELHVLQAGHAQPLGNKGLIAAGTGLGQAILRTTNGRMEPSPTEAGHADWAARNERDIIVLRALIERFGRAEVEHVISGRGLSNLHRITHSGDCPIVENDEAPDAPSLISQAALERRCPGCVDALEIFVDAYGAEAGNLALRAVATGGVFVGGGIAPKILPALTDGRFLRAFLDKGSFRSLLTQIPISIILNREAGLLGAAIAAM